MKYIKILGLLAVAASAFMAFAATASATTITSPTGTPFTGTFFAETEGHAVLHNPVAKIECVGTVHGTVESHGPGVTAKGKITADFHSCTNSWHVTVITSGNLEIHPDTPGGGQYDGTLTSNGATVESTRFGITCRYATAGTDIGTLTGGSTPTIHINGAIPFHSGSGLCGSGSTQWTGSYTVTTPTTGLFVDHD